LVARPLVPRATIPTVTVLERSGDLVKSLRIHFDVAPVCA
jgi:hypothetical protein